VFIRCAISPQYATVNSFFILIFGDLLFSARLEKKKSQTSFIRYVAIRKVTLALEVFYLVEDSK